jgi:hypothetical protein
MGVGVKNMKGKILGFDGTAGSGAITGENGERFTFVSAQWRSDRPIAPGIAVDFAPMAGVATEIYPVAGAITAPDLGELASSPIVQKLRTLAMTTLTFPLAVLLLLATFLPAMSSPMQSVSLWGLGSIMKVIGANPLLSDDNSYATERLAQMERDEGELRQQMAQGNIPMPSKAEIAKAKTGMISMMTGEQTVASRFKEFADEKAKLNQQISDGNWRSMISGALVIRYLVPIGACLLLWLAWSGKVAKTPTLAVGGVSVLFGLLVYLCRGALVGHPVEGSIGEAISQQLDAAVSVGWGTVIIAACGVALLLAGLGVARNPLAAKA